MADKQRLRRILLPLISISALAAILYYTLQLDFTQLSTDLQAEAKQRQQSLVKKSVSIMQKRIQGLMADINAMARDGDIIEKIQSQPYSKIDVYPAIPSASIIRLIRVNEAKLISEDIYPFSYACLDMAIRTTDKKKGFAPEVHLSGTNTQHVAVMAPVKDGDEKVIGVVAVSLPTSWLRKQMAALPEIDGYMELTQGSRNLIASRGDNTQRIGEPIKKKVGKSILKLNYWPRKLNWDDQIQSANVQFTVILVAVCVVLFMYLYLSYRWKLGFAMFTMPSIKFKRKARKKDFADESADNEDVKAKEGLGSNTTDSMILDTSKVVVKDETDNESLKKVAAEQQSDSHKAADEKNVTAADATQNDSAIVIEENEETSMNSESTDANALEEGTAPAVEIPTTIFKAYDIRGVVTNALTADVVYEIGRAFGSEMADQGLDKVVVARDGRLSGPDLISALKRGLSATGRHVIDVGMVPTPVLYYATHELQTGTGIMLTGSHNPPEYNGLKMMMGDETLSSDSIQALLQRLQSGKLYQAEGSIEEQDVLPAYQKRITNDVLLLKKFKLVIDCGNGVAGVIAPQLFRDLGCEVVELFTEVDGTFPNHHPDPSQPKNLKDVIAKVAEEKADMGFAFDGDGDRLGVVTQAGKVIFPDRTMMLFAEDILSRNPGSEIIYDVKCSKNLGAHIESCGGKATMWKTGHSLIKKQMKKSGALLAGEMSGHIFFKERWYGFDDAFYSGARLLEIMVLKASEQSVEEVFAALPDSVNTPELNIKMQEGETHAFVEELAEKASFGDAKVITIDGLRVELPDAWGLIRSSNTTPVLVLRFEADTQAALEKIQAMFREQISALKPDLELPF